MNELKVLIAGAGPVGCALGLHLLELGFPSTSIALIDARDQSSAEEDSRLIALSDASRVLLEHLGGWPAHAATPIHKIHVSHRGAFGRTIIDRSDYGLEALGHVVRYGALVAELNGAVALRGLSVRRPARLVDCDVNNERIRSVVSDQEDVYSAYLVHAEGGLFEAQSPQSIRRDYAQTAITAVVKATYPEAGMAWERFTSDGPIALLPTRLGEDPAYALVWCCKPEDAKRRMALQDSAFVDDLHRSFGDRLGAFVTVGPRASYPLGLNAREEISRLREFAIGNAAQTLHPVAGQGLNLGLRDACCLAELLAEHFDAPLTCMEQFRAARRRDRAATVNLTDWLPRVFASRLMPVAALRGAALTFLDLVGPARNVLARQMMDGQR